MPKGGEDGVGGREEGNGRGREVVEAGEVIMKVIWDNIYKLLRILLST